MKTVTFTYVRHGRTIYNRDEIIQGGGADSPLAPEFKYVVEETAAALADVDFARCYTSPLGRVRETADILLAGRDVPRQILDDLREFNFGSIDGKPYKGKKAVFVTHFFFQDFSDLGGESGSQVRARVRRAFARMYDEAADGDNVLVVSHGSYLRYVQLEFGPGNALARKVRSETMQAGNASITTIEGTDDGFRFVQMPVDAATYLATRR